MRRFFGENWGSLKMEKLDQGPLLSSLRDEYITRLSGGRHVGVRDLRAGGRQCARDYGVVEGADF